MSLGGLFKLVAYGAQDRYLTGDPKITFFEVKYKQNNDMIKTLLEQNTSESMYKLAQYYENQKDYDNMLKYYLLYINNINVGEIEICSLKIAWSLMSSYQIIEGFFVVVIVVVDVT